MLPDFSTLFRRDTVSPLHFRARGLANYVHDIQFLSSYLHDARFSAKGIARRGKKLRITVERDCWELGFTKRPEASELHTARSYFTLGPVSSVRWETDDPSSLQSELTIESIYLGAVHWETPEVSEIVISAPHRGWKLCISIADDFGDIRLDDLETPHLHSKQKT